MLLFEFKKYGLVLEVLLPKKWPMESPMVSKIIFMCLDFEFVFEFLFFRCRSSKEWVYRNIPMWIKKLAAFCASRRRESNRNGFPE